MSKYYIKIFSILTILLLCCTRIQTPPPKIKLKSNIYSTFKSTAVEIIKKPTYNIHYHFVVDSEKNKNDVDLDVLENVHKNVRSAYASIFNLNYDTATFIVNEYDINDFYEEFSAQADPMDNKLWLQLTEDKERHKSINVYIINDSAAPLQSNAKLTGFTPIILDKVELYEQISPQYDNLAVTYSGLFEYELGGSLIHELGHFFGLEHPWQYSHSELELFGLDDKMTTCVNYMNYNCFVTAFTKEQKEFMYFFGTTYRKYLIV